MHAGRQAGSQLPTVWSLLWWTDIPGDPVAIAFFIFPTIYHMAGLWWISRQADFAVAGRTGAVEGGLNLEPWAGEL